MEEGKLKGDSWVVDVEPVDYVVAERAEQVAKDRADNYEAPHTVVLGWQTYITLCRQCTQEGMPLEQPSIILTKYGSLVVMVDASERDMVKVLSEPTDNLLVSQRSANRWCRVGVKKAGEVPGEQ